MLRDSRVKAKHEKKTEVVALLERFKSDAAKTKSEIRKELGINGQYYSYYYYSPSYSYSYSRRFHYLLHWKKTFLSLSSSWILDFPVSTPPKLTREQYLSFVGGKPVLTTGNHFHCLHFHLAPTHHFHHTFQIHPLPRPWNHLSLSLLPLLLRSSPPSLRSLLSLAYSNLVNLPESLCNPHPLPPFITLPRATHAGSFLSSQYLSPIWLTWICMEMSILTLVLFPFGLIGHPSFPRIWVGSLNGTMTQTSSWP